MPYFIMRSGFGTSGVWASAYMGTAWYDDHQHADAGHIMIRRAKDFLLVSAGDFKGDLGSVGYLGSSNENGSASGANTLYFNDRGDSQCADEAQYAGGQSNYGADAVIADEQSTLGTYIRSDLSSAYNTNDPSGCYLSRLQDLRRLDSFYRSFVYVPQGNLFVVYDQAKAKPSTSPRGSYLMHLRWHFPNTPSVQGRRVTVTQGKSSLVMDTLLPSNAALSVVDERNNPAHPERSRPPPQAYFASRLSRAAPLRSPPVEVIPSLFPDLAADLATCQSSREIPIGEMNSTVTSRQAGLIRRRRKRRPGQ